MMKKHPTFALHGIVFLWGFTGILGKLIEIDSIGITWYRMLLAFFALWAFQIWKKIPKITGAAYYKVLGTGGLVALHWFCFFEAIKLSNVSVALVCLSSTTLFTALLEPLFYKRKISGIEIMLSIATIIGITFLFNVSESYFWGIIYGTLAAIFGSIFTVFNGLLVQKHSSITITKVEMLGGLYVASLLFLLRSPNELGAIFDITFMDGVYLLILGVICTAFAFGASVEVMKHVSPFTVAITVNMEPLYSIVLAFLIFKEYQELTWSFYVGTTIIMGTVFFASYLSSKKRRKLKNLDV